ncbi:hypothetical protein ACQJBY_021874 [Aegilops geniculata]
MRTPRAATPVMVAMSFCCNDGLWSGSASLAVVPQAAGRGGSELEGHEVFCCNDNLWSGAGERRYCKQPATRTCAVVATTALARRDSELEGRDRNFCCLMSMGEEMKDGELHSERLKIRSDG